MSMPPGQPAVSPRRAAVPPPPPQAAATAPSPGGRVPPRVWAILAIAVACAVAVTAAVVAARGSDRRQEPGQATARSLSGPLGDRREAMFEVASGAESVAVRSVDLGTELYRVTTPEGGSLRPEISDVGSVVRLTLVHSGAPGVGSVEILLHSAVRWQVRLAGGGTEEVVDFTSGRLSGGEVAGGAGTVRVALPRPEGTLVVRVVGGAGELTVRAPGGPPAQVRIGDGAGAGEVTVDGERHRGVAPGTVFGPDTW